MRKRLYKNLPNNTKFKFTRDSDTWWYKRGIVAKCENGPTQFLGNTKRFVYVPVKKRNTWKARYLRLEAFMQWACANCTPYSQDELRDKYDFAHGM